MSDSDNVIKKRLGKILKLTLSQVSDVAEEVMDSAKRVRDRIDDKQFKEHQKELFRDLGEQTYNLYKYGREQAPNLIKNTISSIDNITGEVITPERIDRFGKTMDHLVHDILNEVNDYIEDSARSQDEPAPSSSPPEKPVKSATPSSPKVSAKAKTANKKNSNTKTKNTTKAKATAKTKSTSQKKTAGKARKKAKKVLPNDPLARVVKKPSKKT